eukprot:scaffold234000_cov23-Prasinocladus_malaysianus.AAC.2
MLNDPHDPIKGHHEQRYEYAAGHNMSLSVELPPPPCYQSRARCYTRLGVIRTYDLSEPPRLESYRRKRFAKNPNDTM